MTGQRIYDLGGVNKVVRPGEALQISLDWAARMASHPPNTLAEKIGGLPQQIRRISNQARSQYNSSIRPTAVQKVSP